MPNMLTAWDAFNRELDNTGVISDSFKARLRAMAAVACEDAELRGQERIQRMVNEAGTYRIEFRYHGADRVVENPTINSDSGLLGGVEITRNGEPTGHFKNYRLSEIGSWA